MCVTHWKKRVCQNLLASWTDEHSQSLHFFSFWHPKWGLFSYFIVKLYLSLCDQMRLQMTGRVVLHRHPGCAPMARTVGKSGLDPTTGSPNSTTFCSPCSPSSSASPWRDGQTCCTTYVWLATRDPFSFNWTSGDWGEPSCFHCGKQLPVPTGLCIAPTPIFTNSWYHK